MRSIAEPLGTQGAARLGSPSTRQGRPFALTRSSGSCSSLRRSRSVQSGQTFFAQKGSSALSTVSAWPSSVDATARLLLASLQHVSTQRWLTTHGVAAAVSELVATGAVDVPGVDSPQVIHPSVAFPALAAAGITLGDCVIDIPAPEFMVG